MFWGPYDLTDKKTPKEVNPFVTLRFLFDNLWCLGEAQTPCYKITTLKCFYIYGSFTVVHFHIAFKRVFSVS